MQLPRRFLKKTVIFITPALLWGLGFVYDRRYLKGRYFEEDLRGLIWSLRSFWCRNILRLAPPLPFPAGLSTTVTNWRNVEFHAEDINHFQAPGAYFQCSAAKIRLGRGVYIAANVGMVTANHDPRNPDRHLMGADIVIGEKSWIGMNCIILPGVTLGPGTIVAAGSVVNKSFPDGHQLLAGSPAVLKRRFDALG